MGVQYILYMCNPKFDDKQRKYIYFLCLIEKTLKSDIIQKKESDHCPSDSPRENPGHCFYISDKRFLTYAEEILDKNLNLCVGLI